MQDNQHFVQSLITLRDHYQALNDDSERFLAHAKEQLTHVNALLVDRLGENQRFVESLIGLRDHYQGLLEKYSSSSAHAREQLTHVNALLVDQLVLPDNQQRVSIQASTVTPLQHNHSLSGNRGESVDRLGEDEEPNLTDSTIGADEKALNADQKQFSSGSESGQKPHQFPVLKTQMVPKYQHLSKTQAVKKLLQDNAGSILHVDYIIRALHGDLDADALRAEKPRMYDTLSKGTSKGLWDKVPDQASCYTIDLKLADPDLASKKLPNAAKLASVSNRNS